MRNVSAAVLALAAFGIGTAQAEELAYDKVFADRAYAADLAEAKLALDKTGNDNVRKLAQRLIHDRGAANEELAQAAKAEGIGLPTLPTNTQRAEIARLDKLAGNDFDQAYLNDQINDGGATVVLYMAESKTGQGSTLKAVAQRALPLLNDQLQLAKSLAAAR